MKFKRNLSWIIPIFAVLTWAIILIAIVKSPASFATEMPEEDGRLSSDDIPATSMCYMTDVEVQEDYENERIESALLARSHVIEGCTITFYCNERYPHICGAGNGITADGTLALAWATCAVDPDVIPLGSTVLVDLGDGEGLRTLVANDTGVKGSRLDICVGSHEEALQMGRQTAAVYWCEE